MAHEVFLCHSARDKAIADAACAALEAQRISCWIAPRDVLAGEEWGKSIIEALSSSNIVVLIFSGYANESPQVRREIERAVSKAKIIVPFRIENVLPSDAMEYALGNTHWLDAMSPPMEQSLSNLCQTICRLLQRQHPLQPLWKPGDAAAAAETQVEKATPKEETPVSRPVERAVAVPPAAATPPSRPAIDLPSQQVASGERIVSHLVVAVPPPIPAAPVQPVPHAPVQARPPAPVQPIAPAPVQSSPAVPVQAPVPFEPVRQHAAALPPKATSSGSKGWILGLGIAAVLVVAALAVIVPRLGKTPSPVDTPAASATAAPAPTPAPVEPTTPVVAATPAPETTVDQPAPVASRDTPASGAARASSPAKTTKLALGTPAPIKLSDAPLARAVPMQPAIGKDLQLAEDECAAGTPHGCMIAGQRSEHGEGTAKDEGQARTFYQKACDLGEARGCTNLALMYETSQKPENAVLFYRKGCDKGNPIGCTQLGVMYDKGQGVSQDYAQAATLYRRGCDGGNLRACSNLGSLYLGGRGVARDESQAMNLYRQACSGGYEIACGHMKTQSP